MVVKSSGAREPFERSKIVAGVGAAIKGRAVPPEVVEELAVAVEDEVRLAGTEVASSTIGLLVLERLRSIDEVAYLRFASVYKEFDAAADFRREIELLKKSGAAPNG